jgi:hypothetical protein
VRTDRGRIATSALLATMLASCAHDVSNISAWSRQCINRTSWRTADPIPHNIIAQIIDDYHYHPYFDSRYPLRFEGALTKDGISTQLYIFTIDGISDVEIGYLVDRNRKITNRYVISPYMSHNDIRSCL